MRRACVLYSFYIFLLLAWAIGARDYGYAKEGDPFHTVSGTVQNQNLRRVDQALVQVRDQEGNIVVEGVTNQAGEFSLKVPKEGIYSIHAIQETYRSEYAVVTVGKERLPAVNLTLSMTKEIALEIVSSLPPIQYKASSETYQLSRKDVETL